MYKKVIMLFVVLLLSTHAYAQFNSSRVSTTVSSIKTMWDNSLVILEGYLVTRLDEKQLYIFKDSTGRIEVKIEYQNFKSLSVDSKTKVKLWGSVDVLWPSKSRRINVDYVEVVISPKELAKERDAKTEKDCICDN